MTDSIEGPILGLKPAGLAFYKALLAATTEVKRIGKDGHNESAKGYDYTSADALIEYSNQILHRHGLVVLRHHYAVGNTIRDEGTVGKYGKSSEQVMRMVTSAFWVIHSETGEREMFAQEFPAILSQGRPWDKSIAAALTSGLGYFYRDLLMIPRTDCPDSMDARDDSEGEGPRGYEPPPQKKQPAKKQPAKKKTPAKKTPPKKEADAPTTEEIEQKALMTKVYKAIDEAADTDTLNTIAAKFSGLSTRLTEERMGKVDKRWVKAYEKVQAESEG